MHRLGAAVVLSSLVACTASHDPDVHAWLTEYHVAACASAACAAGDWSEVPFRARPAACADVTFPNDEVALALVANGSLSFDAGAGRACLDALSSGRCAAIGYVDDGVAACAGVLLPGPLAAGLGERCDSRACAAGLRCGGPGPSSAGCTAAPTCIAVTPDGGACTVAFECGAPSAGRMMVCASSHCASAIADPPVAAGASCAPRTVAGEVHVAACTAGTSCVAGTCTALAMEGQACDVGTPCGPGLACPYFGGTCARVSIVAEGASCNPIGGGPFCDETAGLVCTPSGTCVPLGDGTSGEACGGLTGWDCASGLRCDYTMGTCAPLLPAGAHCDIPNDCASGICGADRLCASC